MCLIISGDRKIPLNVDFIKDVAQRNNDGYGMMWIEDGAVKTEKSFEKDPQKILDAINKVYQYNPFIHFRMRTHGKVNIDNCHPYNCGHSIYLMHNGVLSHGNKANEDFSDTWHFIQDIIKPLFESLKNPHKFIRTVAFNQLCKQYVGYNNRLVFLDRGGPCLINHDTWTKVKNEWTGVKGLYVSNSYAWNEQGFRDPNHWPSKTSHLGATGHIRDTKGTGTSKGEQAYVSDRFKDRFEEYQHPYYLDDEWNVWEQKGRGFKRRFDLEWSDLSIMPPKEEPTALREIVDSCVVATPKDIVVHDATPKQLEIPALVVVPRMTEQQASLILAEDQVEGGATVSEPVATTVTSPPTITQEVYQTLLINTYKRFSAFDLERRFAEDPEEAVNVFQSLLRSVS